MSMEDPKNRVKFIAYYHFVSWKCISLGIHVCANSPNIEIHLPFGFIRVGWERNWECLSKTYGIK